MSKVTPSRGILVRVLLGSALVVAVLGLATARVLVEGERELRTAEALAAAGKLEQAVVHARRSASWYTPGAPHVPAAYQQLITIARLAESRGDPRTAVFAWRSVRAAALSSRWIRVPHEREVALAEVSIARLAAKVAPSPGATVHAPEEVEADLLAALTSETRPRIPWVIMMLAGFVTLSAGLAHMAFRGSIPEHGFRWDRLRVGGSLALFGFVAWGIALWFA